MPVEMPEPQVAAVSPVDVDVPLRLPAPAPVRVAVGATPEPSPSAASTPTQSKTEPTAIRQARPASRGPLSADRVDRPPREKPGNPRPAYPSIAARRGIEGLVRTRLVIDAQGRVQEVDVLEVKGHPQFRQAVLEVVRRLRFEPAEHEGRSVAVVATKQFRFMLEDR
jgi:protein TonB